MNEKNKNVVIRQNTTKTYRYFEVISRCIRRDRKLYGHCLFPLIEVSQNSISFGGFDKLSKVAKLISITDIEV